MKRKVLCVFSLVLFLIVFCTILSPWVSREMQTLVEIKKITGKVTMRNPNVAGSAIHFQETDDILFQIVDGEGWQAGQRVQEVSRWSYRKEMGHVSINAGTKLDVILSASRQPVPGDAVAVVEEFTEGEDTFLILWPEGSLLNTYPNSFTWIADSENAVLVSFHKARFPYFEHRYLSTVESLVPPETLVTIDPETGEQTETVIEPPRVRIISMTETRQLLESLPLVAVVATLLLMGIFLWAHGCILSRKGWRKPLRNAVLGAAILGALSATVERIDLPASMLPPKSLLDISHYAEELSAIRSQLSAMGSTILDDAFSYAVRGSAVVAGIGVAAMVALLLLDRLWKTKD